MYDVGVEGVGGVHILLATATFGDGILLPLATLGDGVLLPLATLGGGGGGGFREVLLVTGEVVCTFLTELGDAHCCHVETEGELGDACCCHADTGGELGEMGELFHALLL